MTTTNAPTHNFESENPVLTTEELRPRHLDTSVGAPEAQQPDASGAGSDKGSLWRLAIVAALVVALGRAAGANAVAMVAAFVILIVFHELGHYLAARRAGMKVTEFFVGFGPKIWSTQRGETEYGIKMIPAGAYVKIIGMNNLEPVAPQDEDRTYRSGRYRDRLSVVLAGPFTNLVLGFVGLVVLYMGWGFFGADVLVNGIDETNWVISQVQSVDDEGEPTTASILGLEPGDRITSINGQSVALWDDVVSRVSSMRPGADIDIEVDRDGRILEMAGTLGTRVDEEGNEHGFLGVGPGFDALDVEPVGFGTAMQESAHDYSVMVKESVAGIASLFRPSTWQALLGFGDPTPPVASSGGGGVSDESSPQFTGAIGIIDGARGSFHMPSLLIMWALINVFVGLFNLVPLLPLDGGHAIVATYEAIHGRIVGNRQYRVDYARLVPITVTVIAMLFFLFVIVTSRDVMNIVERVN